MATGANMAFGPLLIVRNFPDSATNAELKELFAPFGAIRANRVYRKAKDEEVYLAYDFAGIQFVDQEQVNNVIEFHLLNPGEFTLGGNQLNIYNATDSERKFFVKKKGNPGPQSFEDAAVDGKAVDMSKHLYEAHSVLGAQELTGNSVAAAAALLLKESYQSSSPPSYASYNYNQAMSSMSISSAPSPPPSIAVKKVLQSAPPSTFPSGIGIIIQNLPLTAEDDSLLQFIAKFQQPLRVKIVGQGTKEVYAGVQFRTHELAAECIARIHNKQMFEGNILKARLMEESERQFFMHQLAASDAIKPSSFSSASSVMERCEIQPGQDISRMTFYFIDFESYFMNEHVVYPCEVSIAKFSPTQGLIDLFHRMINPGRIHPSFGQTVQYNIDRIHGIPQPSNSSSDSHIGFESNLRSIYSDICEFLSVDPEATHPDPRLLLLAKGTTLENRAMTFLASQSGFPSSFQKAVGSVKECTSALDAMRHLIPNPPRYEEVETVFRNNFEEILHRSDCNRLTGCTYHRSLGDSRFHCAMSDVMAKALAFQRTLAECFPSLVGELGVRLSNAAHQVWKDASYRAREPVDVESLPMLDNTIHMTWNAVQYH